MGGHKSFDGPGYQVQSPYIHENDDAIASAAETPLFIVQRISLLPGCVPITLRDSQVVSSVNLKSLNKMNQKLNP